MSAWGWTTPYDDPWITIALKNLLPMFLWPLFGSSLLGLLWMLFLALRAGGADHRLMFVLHSAVIGAALAVAAPALGIIDVRFVPFAQLALCLAGAITIGLAFQRLAAGDLAALAVVLLGVVYADGQSRVLRAWVDWNYTGLQAKELWPAFAEVTERLRGTVSDPRVAVEYHAAHERAGSIRMYETLPLFSGRSTLEGVYNQASLQTHAVYFLASELDANSPNPFRKREYSQFDTESALRPPAPVRREPGGRAQPAPRGQPGRAPGGAPDRARAAVLPSTTSRGPGAGTWSRWPSRPCAPRGAAGATSPTAGSRASRSPPRYLVFTDDPRFEVVREGRMAGSARSAAAARSGGAGEGRRRDDHDHHQPRGPSPAGEGLVPPAAGRRRARTVPISSPRR